MVMLWLSKFATQMFVPSNNRRFAVTPTGMFSSTLPFDGSTRFIDFLLLGQTISRSKFRKAAASESHDARRATTYGNPEIQAVAASQKGACLEARWHRAQGRAVCRFEERNRIAANVANEHTLAIKGHATRI